MRPGDTKCGKRLAANTANYKFCGAESLPSFPSHDVMKQADVDGDIARLREHLAAAM